jgi:hypothetical protein
MSLIRPYATSLDTDSKRDADILELNDPGRDTAVALAEAYLASDFPHLDWQLDTVLKDTVRRNDTGVYELTYCTPIPELIVGGPRTILVTPSTRAVELLFRD